MWLWQGPWSSCIMCWEVWSVWSFILLSGAHSLHGDTAIRMPCRPGWSLSFLYISSTILCQKKDGRQRDVVAFCSSAVMCVCVRDRECDLCCCVMSLNWTPTSFAWFASQCLTRCRRHCALAVGSATVTEAMHCSVIGSVHAVVLATLRMKWSFCTIRGVSDSLSYWVTCADQLTANPGESGSCSLLLWFMFEVQLQQTNKQTSSKKGRGGQTTGQVCMGLTGRALESQDQS